MEWSDRTEIALRDTASSACRPRVPLPLIPPCKDISTVKLMQQHHDYQRHNIPACSQPAFPASTHFLRPCNHLGAHPCPASNCPVLSANAPSSSHRADCTALVRSLKLVTSSALEDVAPSYLLRITHGTIDTPTASGKDSEPVSVHAPGAGSTSRSRCSPLGGCFFSCAMCDTRCLRCNN